MSPRLILYSDQSEGKSNDIDDRLFSMLPASGATIGYLPSSPDPNRTWFRDREDHYAKRRAKLRFFGLETEFDREDIEELFQCDAIHLTGGNTFQFLYWLRKRGLVPRLQSYAASGGVLTGVSAGAILMTPDTSTSFICGDVAYPGLKGFMGLALVPFAFVPHFDASESMMCRLLEFSTKFDGQVYGVPDGSGIVVDGAQTDLVGPVWRAAEGVLDHTT